MCDGENPKCQNIPFPELPKKNGAKMAKTGYDFYKEAIALRNAILDGKSTETPVKAWAAVCRACAKANDAYRAEFDAKSFGRGYGRFELCQLENLDAVWWIAKAQVETLGRRAE